MANWYCNVRGQQIGPVGDDVLQQMSQSGQLQPTDMVWREGMPQWAAAGTVPGLFVAQPAPMLGQPGLAQPSYPPGAYPQGAYGQPTRYAGGPKVRHGCLTAWLILMIIANSGVALMYVGWLVSGNSPLHISSSLLTVLVVGGVCNVIFAIMLLQWKRWAFYGFCASSVVALFTNLAIGIAPGQAAAGLLGVGILYGVLQMGTPNAWQQLE